MSLTKTTRPPRRPTSAPLGVAPHSLRTFDLDDGAIKEKYTLRLSTVMSRVYYPHTFQNMALDNAA
jgi:hypothetical protein